MFGDIGDDLATCMFHSPQEMLHETEESDKEIVDPVPSLKVERS